MATGCSLHPALRHQEGETPRCRHGKTDAQKEHFVAHNAGRDVSKKWRISRSFPMGSSVSWFATQNWLNRGEWNGIEMDKLAQEHNSCWPSSEEFERCRKKLTSHCTNRARMHDETPIRLPNSSHCKKPSPPRIWEKNDLNQFLFINTKVAFVVFFQYFMVAAERTLVEFINRDC